MHWQELINQLFGAVVGVPGGTGGTGIGSSQIKTATIDLNQAAGTYDLFTGSAQIVSLYSLVFKCPVGAAGGALTSISIHTDYVTPQVIIPAVDGVVGNLTWEAQLSWTGAILLGVGKKIQLTIAGGATGAAYVCTVVVEYTAVTSGGVLV
jgi:hypothetical protein